MPRESKVKSFLIKEEARGPSAIGFNSLGRVVNAINGDRRETPASIRAAAHKHWPGARERNDWTPDAKRRQAEAAYHRGHLGSPRSFMRPRGGYYPDADKGHANVNDKRKERGYSPGGYVVAIDSFLSGWGGAAGGRSYYAVAVSNDRERDVVARNMKRRGDMKSIRYPSILPNITAKDHISIRDRHSAPKFFEEGGFSPRSGSSRKHSASATARPRARQRMEIATARFSPLHRTRGFMDSARRKTKLDELREELPTGYTVHTWSPGDGVTRYRFFHNAPSSQSYFGPANGTYTALGFKEAHTFARGLLGNRPNASPKHKKKHRSK
jgi:hypothetical protein